MGVCTVQPRHQRQTHTTMVSSFATKTIFSNFKAAIMFFCQLGGMQEKNTRLTCRGLMDGLWLTCWQTVASLHNQQTRISIKPRGSTWTWAARTKTEIFLLSGRTHRSFFLL